MAGMPWGLIGMTTALLDIPGVSLINGLVVTMLAVLLVLGRVLWPKEVMQRWRENRAFRASVGEMRQGLDKLENEQYADALALFKIAAERTPNKPAPVLLRSYALGMQGQHSQATLELRNALKKWPVDTLPRRLLALAYLGAGQFDRAYAAGTTAAAEEPIAAAALRSLGDICRMMERYPEAERLYNQAIQAEATRPSAGLAWVLASQGRVEDAEDELYRVPAQRRQLFETQLTLAHIHSQARRYDEALPIYYALLDQHAEVPRVLVPCGVTLHEAGQAADARRALERAVTISPESPFAHCGLATVLVEANDLATATVHVREALRLWPGYGHARSVYGDVLKRSGRYDAAEEQYREALRLNPFLAETHTRLGALLRSRQANDEAREHEREAHRLRPSIPLAMSQKMQSITSAMLAVHVTPPTSSADVPAITVVQTPTAKRLPDLQAQSPQEQIPSTPIPSLPGDIAAFPGAALVFDQSRESVLTQTLHTTQPPEAVLTFYRKNMTANHWQLMDEAPSTVEYLDGLTLRYERVGQSATITIGLRQTALALPRGTPEAQQTVIVTTVSLW